MRLLPYDLRMFTPLISVPRVPHFVLGSSFEIQGNFSREPDKPMVLKWGLTMGRRFSDKPRLAGARDLLEIILESKQLLLRNWGSNPFTLA